MHNNARTERLSQGTNREEANLPDIHAEASALADRVLQTVQQTAGTAYCKGIQITELTKWAREQNLWVDDMSLLGIYQDRGSENEVYLSHDRRTVYKLNDFRYSDDNLTPFFERLKAHNHYFPDCRYDVVGFGFNHSGKTCVMLAQPFIVADREATEGEIHAEMQRLGFMPQMDGEYYSNGTHDLFDVCPNNVLMGVDGRLYFIDTIIYLSSENTLDTYRNQSPKDTTFSKESSEL